MTMAGLTMNEETIKLIKENKESLKVVLPLLEKAWLEMNERVQNRQGAGYLLHNPMFLRFILSFTKEEKTDDKS